MLVPNACPLLWSPGWAAEEMEGGDLAFEVHRDQLCPWRQALARIPCDSAGHWLGFTQGPLKY